MEILFLIKNKIDKIISKITTFLGINTTNNIYYIGSNETLPPPLTTEEENEILSRIKKDNTVRKTLVERNLRLVVYIAKKFENTQVPLEDLVSIGTIGLVKAINTYDVDKKIKLATYASRCIENEILMHLRKINKIKNEVSIDEPLNTDGDGNELLLSDIIGTEDDVVPKEFEFRESLPKTLIGKVNYRELENENSK